MMKGPVRVFKVAARRSLHAAREISVRLEIASCRSEPAFQTITWDGGITNVSFIVAPTDEFSGNSIIGWCIFSLNGSRIGQVAFEVSLRASGHSEFVSSAMVRRAFASYAHQDRREVLARVAGIEKVGLEVFIDAHNLRSNDNWRESIHNEIDFRLCYICFGPGTPKLEGG